MIAIYTALTGSQNEWSPWSELKTLSSNNLHSVNVSYYHNENLILNIISCSNPAGRMERVISKLRE